MRRQIREPNKLLPVRRRAGEPVIKPPIHHQIPPNRVRHRPQITHRIRIEIRLRKMPDLAGDREPPRLTRDRQRVKQIRPA